MMYTASYAFFEALYEAGIRYCFVNLGSDHPSIMEAYVRGEHDKKDQYVKLITCPNEMVALSMADGYARLTGKPQCVLVHVDVGTQGLAAAVHDACMGRCPVLIFAGISPVTIEGETRGSRTEYIHWIQDVPDQRQIVAQYCRYTAEIKNSRNIKQMVNRALSFAMSDPKGPVYLCGAREVMEEEIKPYELDQRFWRPVEPTALPQSGVELIAETLTSAAEPLVLVGYTGRNHNTVPALVELATVVKGLRVLDTGGVDMCFPADHPAWIGMRYGADDSIRTADVILVIDCDVPWIPTQCKPKADAKIIHIDVDPLKQIMPVFYLNAIARYRADSHTALTQILQCIGSSSKPTAQLSDDDHRQRWQRLTQAHQQKLQDISKQAAPGMDGSYGASYLMSEVRKACPRDTIWVIEAVTASYFVADQLQTTLPGTWINCGGGGLGWSGGASLGVKLATMGPDWKGKKPAFICQVVGDGTFLFSVPSAVYWISQRYAIPTLTIVINNRGWNAPKRSLLLVHPDGEASKVSNEDLHISFAPTPDYAGIAKAASGGRIWAGRTAKAEELGRLLKEAVETVEGGRSAVLDAQLDGSVGVYSEKEASGD